MKPIAWTVCALIAAAILASAGPVGSIAPMAVPVALDPADESRDEVGQLRFLGGVALSSPQPEFGGLSGLSALPDGRLIAVTDAGSWIVLTPQEEAGWLTGVSEMRLAPLLGPGGRPLDGKANADAEALTPLPAGGFAVAFERRNAVDFYRGPADRPEAWNPEGGLSLPGVDALPENGGIEALAATGRDSFVAISEEGVGPGSSYLAWRVTPQKTYSFGYEPPIGYVATDAVQIDDDSILVLNRRFSLFSGVGAALVRIPLSAIRPGVLVSGEVIAELAPPLTVDNMEGVALRREADGTTVLYLVSDDNFSRLQRTLLLKFAWPDAN